jgi:predicted NBD/HSP70 family sugar kinase
MLQRAKDTHPMSHPQVVLGLDFGGTKIAAAVCDPAGHQLASAVVSSRAELGAAASFAHGIATAKGLLQTTANAGQLVAVGAATFGIPFEDRVELAPAIKGWEALAFGRELAAAFPGVRVAAATDAKAAARAEVRWGALAGYDPAVYLNLGTGLAAAVVAGGEVVTGRHGAAGEIGYSLREHADVGLAAGRRVLLEDMVSGLALARRAAKLGRRLTAAEVFAASATDPELDDIVTAFVRELAFHLVNLAIVVDPARIAVGGGIVSSWHRIEPVLADALARAVPYPPELVLAHFPHDAPLLGAIALAVDAASPAAEAADPQDADETTQPDERSDQSAAHNGAAGAPAVSSGGK